MKTVLPREQAVEDIFSRILASPEASGRLRKVFYQYLDDEHMLVDEDPDHFLQVLFHAYQNGDVSALLLELCGKSMFDLLREAYLIPRKFHGKAGENPVLLTNVEGELLPEAGKMVSAHEYGKFKETFDRHECVPRSGLYLADGYDIVHSYSRIPVSWVLQKPRLMPLYGRLSRKSSRQHRMPSYSMDRRPV